MAERDPRTDPAAGDILCAGKTRYEVKWVCPPGTGPAAVRLLRTDSQGRQSYHLWALNYYFDRARRMEVFGG